MHIHEASSTDQAPSAQPVLSAHMAAKTGTGANGSARREAAQARGSPRIWGSAQGVHTMFQEAGVAGEILQQSFQSGRGESGYSFVGNACQDSAVMQDGWVTRERLIAMLVCGSWFVSTRETICALWYMCRCDIHQ